MAGLCLAGWLATVHFHAWLDSDAFKPAALDALSTIGRRSKPSRSLRKVTSVDQHLEGDIILGTTLTWFQSSGRTLEL